MHDFFLICNPPLLGDPDVILCPPLNTEAYMKYLSDHKEDYRKFFGASNDRGL